MRPKNFRIYFLIGLLLFFLIVSSLKSTYFKGIFIGFLIPFWENMSPSNNDQEIKAKHLLLENHLLKEKNSEMKELIDSLIEFKKSQANDLLSKTIPAKIIYRSPSFWENTLWINVGEKLIEKNSPVVFGNCLVGIVEETHSNYSVVRLITDSSLCPSVRVLREGQYLAKGELHGSGNPLWRSKGHRLKGVGFNYDFLDEEGVPIDLRSSNPVLIKAGDLLVTTGLDGIFPKGLQVGIVNHVETLKEGDYFYSIEAKPVLENFDNLTFVFILPPLNF